MLRFYGFIIILLSLSGKASVGLCGDYKFRARENYEILFFNDPSDDNPRYEGLSTSIHYYYEKPYDLSYGLIVNPGLSTIRNNSEPIASLGSRLRYFEAGGDIKYFPFKNVKFFTRGILAFQYVKTSSGFADRRGFGLSTSVGWEFWMYDLFSLAPEIGYKHSNLDDNISSDALIISLGVHFY